MVSEQKLFLKLCAYVHVINQSYKNIVTNTTNMIYNNIVKMQYINEIYEVFAIFLLQKKRKVFRNRHTGGDCKTLIGAVVKSYDIELRET